MRRIFTSVVAYMLCMALFVPMADATERGRNQGGNQTVQSSRPKERPGNMGNGHNTTPSIGSANRPGVNNKPSAPNQNVGNRPNNPNQGGNNRPSAPAPGVNNRPTGPSHGQHPGGAPNYRPSTPPQGHPSHGPGNNYHPGHPGHNMMPGVPNRPMMPPPRPWIRPTPPPVFNGYVPFSPIRTILGVTFGTAINLTINQLINSGYTVQGYGNGEVYVANATQLNMIWPNATLYYHNGGLVGSEFVYSTPGYDMSRYNVAYSRLVGAYGLPYSTQSTSNGVSATWWSNNGQFITLSYASAYASNGSLRYFTTLSFGN